MVMMMHVCPGHMVDESTGRGLLFDRHVHEDLDWPMDWQEPEDAASPRVEVIADEEGAVVSAELPGVDPKDLEVSFARGHLRISGTRKPLEAGESGASRTGGYESGRFWRVVHLGDGYDGDKAKAGMANGMLTVRVPMSETYRPRKIEVVRE